MTTQAKRKAVSAATADESSRPKDKAAATEGKRRKKPKRVRSEQAEWCVCAHCQPEAVPAKRICCGNAPADCYAVTEAAEIQALLQLVDADIAAHPDLWTTTPPPASVAVMTNRQKRMVCYRKLFRLRVGIGRQGHKVPQPSCCRAPIDNQYPRAAGHP